MLARMSMQTPSVHRQRDCKPEQPLWGSMQGSSNRKQNGRMIELFPSIYLKGPKSAHFRDMCLDAVYCSTIDYSQVMAQVSIKRRMKKCCVYICNTYILYILYVYSPLTRNNRVNLLQKNRIEVILLRKQTDPKGQMSVFSLLYMETRFFRRHT